MINKNKTLHQYVGAKLQHFTTCYNTQANIRQMSLMFINTGEWACLHIVYIIQTQSTARRENKSLTFRLGVNRMTKKIRFQELK